VADSTAGGFLTVYSPEVGKPTASSINFDKGWIGANSVTTGVGSGGKVLIYNGNGATNVIADVVGFYAADTSVVAAAGPNAADFYPTKPTRAIDTRNFGDAGRLKNGYYQPLSWDFKEYNPYIRAVAVNITAVSPTGNGYLSAWNGDESAFPTTSTLNYTSGHNVTNMAIVPTSPCFQDWCADSPGMPMIAVLNTNPSSASASTHLVVDIVGEYDNATPGDPDALRFRPITPQRITDTRIGPGIPPLGKGATGNVTPPALLAQAEALALNATAVKPTANTFLTLWPSGLDRPTASNLNPAIGQTVSNAAVVGLDADKAFSVYNLDGTTDVVLDAVGTFQNIYPTGTANAAGAQQKAQAQNRSISGGSRSGTPINGTLRAR
jgi:hypothetical protein